MKDKVMIVDDQLVNRLILSEILSDDYDIIEAENGQAALDMLKNSNVADLPQAVLLDLMMPGIDGFEVLSEMKQTPVIKSIPVLFITAAEEEDCETKGLKEGAADYIQNPFNPDVVKARVDNHVKLYHYQMSLEDMVAEKTRELSETHEKMLETLATIIEYRSLESGAHIRRTCELTRILIKHMLTKPMFAEELKSLDYDMIVKASALHDIGKVGIPDNILLKPGRLTPAEFEIIKSHSVIGSNIIDSMKINGSEMYLKHCRDICRHHHERWDGTGYPDRLFHEEIPLSARIVSLVDVYDALVSKRCYKPGYSLDETYAILKSGSGIQFQPEIVECMFEVSYKLEKLEREMGDDNSQY